MKSINVRLSVTLAGTLLAILASSGRAAAQAVHEQGASAVDRPDWGTQDRILSHVAFSEFSPASSATGYDGGAYNYYGRFSTAANGVFWAVPHVPSGALLTYLELDYCDQSDTGNVLLKVYDCDYRGGDCGTGLASVSSGTGQKGCTLVSQDLTSLNFTVDNNSRELVLVGATETPGGFNQINGAYIGYRLQISVAPMSPTFADVPTSHTYYRAIEALAASGITGGCGNGNFCPDKNVSRGEMAAFLARALGLHYAN